VTYVSNMLGGDDVSHFPSTLLRRRHGMVDRLLENLCQLRFGGG
jgi:hypothetical protein